MSLEQWFFSPAAFGKVYTHAHNYPSQSVSGLLIGKVVNVGAEKQMLVEDVLPLFHTYVQLSPMLKVGIAHAKEWAKDRGLVLVGYYSAPANLTDRPALTPFAEKAVKLISEGNSFPSLALSIINSKLTPTCEEVPFKFFNSTDLKSGRTAESGCCKFGYLEGGEVPAVLPDQESVHERVRTILASGACLVDFEAHLDDPNLDFTNPSLTQSLNSGIVPQ